MMPFISLELRWFLHGPIPKPMERWFLDALPRSEIKTDTRSDTYLFQPGAVDVGIKVRPKKPGAPYSLEAKWRQFARPYIGKRDVAGKVERWLKWGWEDPAGPDDRQLDPWSLPQGPWITVAKARQQRKYSWDDTRDQFQPVSPDTFPELGAAIEIAALELEGQPHSTVLIEAFAPDADVQMHLLNVGVETFWEEYPQPVPGAELSRGYPAWLATHVETRDDPSHPGAAGRTRKNEPSDGRTDGGALAGR